MQQRFTTAWKFEYKMPIFTASNFVPFVTKRFVSELRRSKSFKVIDFCFYQKFIHDFLLWPKLCHRLRDITMWKPFHHSFWGSTIFVLRLSWLVHVDDMNGTGDKSRLFSSHFQIWQNNSGIFYRRQSWLVANSVHSADTDKTRLSCLVRVGGVNGVLQKVEAVRYF